MGLVQRDSFRKTNRTVDTDNDVASVDTIPKDKFQSRARSKIPPSKTNASGLKSVRDTHKHDRSFETDLDDSFIARLTHKRPSTIIVREKITKVYVKDVGTQCSEFTDVNTQTDTENVLSINGGKDLADLLKMICSSTTVTSGGKPVFHCKDIASKITLLTGTLIEPSWVYDVLQ